jgi:hypothetical protein
MNQTNNFDQSLLINSNFFCYDIEKYIYFFKIWQIIGNKFKYDLEDYFKTLDGVPLEKLKERFYNELHILFELFVILYADDTVLRTEQIISINLYKLIQIFFVMILKNIFIFSKYGK